MRESAIKKKKSPILLTMTAFIADFIACRRVVQKPISKNEQIPTPSHPKKTITKLSAETSNSIKKVKRVKYDTKRGTWGSLYI